MIRVEFSKVFESPVWSTTMESRSADVGLVRVGELGLISLLSSQLGLSLPDVPQLRTKRLLAYRNAIETYIQHAPKAFFAESFRHDPIAVSDLLLDERDCLVRAGWQANRIAEVARTETFAAIEETLKKTDGRMVTRGQWDTLVRICDLALEGTIPTSISEIYLYGREQKLLSPIWARIFEVYQKAGLKILNLRESALPLATAGSDLQKLASGSTTPAPSADGTFRILRGRDPWDAARTLSAWISERDFLKSQNIVVIANSESRGILRAALNERGIAFGGDIAVNGFARPGIQILLLALQLLWEPKDASAALALLLIQGSPVRPKVAKNLASALSESLAIGGTAWQTALTEGLDKIDAPEDREKQRRRITDWFEAPTFRLEDGVPTSAVTATCKRVSDWLRIRHEIDTADANPSFLAGIDGANRLSELVQAQRSTMLSHARLSQLVSDAVLESAAVTSLSAQANGVFAVDSPSQIHAPVDVLIWWDFHLSSIPKIQSQTLWSKACLRKMANAGVVFDEPSAATDFVAHGWSQPLKYVRSNAVMVTWGEDSSGDASHAHPSFAEWAGENRKEWQRQLAAERTETPSSFNSVFLNEAGLSEKRAEVSPFVSNADWIAPKARITLRETESPSSLKTLLGCELQYALRYQAGLRGATEHSTKIDNRLRGIIVHELLAQVYPKDQKPDPKAAAKVAGALADELLNKFAPELLRPHRKIEWLRFKSDALSAVQHYGLFLEENNFRVVGAEETLGPAQVAGIQISGTPDAILETTSGQRMVIDHKWSGEKYHYEDLSLGRALQLAVYSELDGSKKKLIVGYNILSTGKTLVLNMKLHRAVKVEGPSLAETIKEVKEAVKTRAGQLSSGKIRARGHDDEASETKWAPACGFCEYSALCGHAWKKTS